MSRLESSISLLPKSQAQKYRRELFGEDALKLKHGKLAVGLSADGNNVEIFER